MTSALNPIRALFVAVVCFAALAAWAPFASAQTVDVPVSATGDVIAPDPPASPPVDPPPVDPPVDPAPPPPADPAPVDPPPADPAPVDPAPVEIEPAADRSTSTRDDHSEPARTPTFTAPQNSAAITVPSDAFAAPAQLPPAGPGEDFALTGKGDAFIFGSGGSSGSGPTALLGSFSRFGSIATAAARVPALGARERAARDAARANANSSGIVMVDDSGTTGLFFKMFGGGGGGGAAMMMLTVLGLLAVVRLLPPEALKNFLISAAVWRPSAYVPPIEHPG